MMISEKTKQNRKQLMEYGPHRGQERTIRHETAADVFGGNWSARAVLGTAHSRLRERHPNPPEKDAGEGEETRGVAEG